MIFINDIHSLDGTVRHFNSFIPFFGQRKFPRNENQLEFNEKITFGIESEVLF